MSDRLLYGIVGGLTVALLWLVLFLVWRLLRCVWGWIRAWAGGLDLQWGWLSLGQGMGWIRIGHTRLMWKDSRRIPPSYAERYGDEKWNYRGDWAWRKVREA